MQSSIHRLGWLPVGPAAVLVATWCGLVAPAVAVGRVEAVALGVSDLQSGPTALLAAASSGTFSASTSRVDSSTSAAVVGGSYPPSLGVSTLTSSDFTVLGLDNLTPLTFHWTFTAARTWHPDNTVFHVNMAVGLTAPGFIDNVGWGISYVDYPPAFGDFAGTLVAPFGVAAAGVGYSNGLPVGDWNGQGSRDVTITMLWAITGGTGNFGASIESGNAGDLAAQHHIGLSGLSVPAGTLIAPGGAWLLLDNGQQLPIATAVPEPQTWLLLGAGLLWLGRRRRPQG